MREVCYNDICKKFKSNTLIKSGGGTGPVKPGNLSENGKGANS